MKLQKTLHNALCLSLITAFTLTAMPKRSEAIVGLATGMAPLAIAGAVVAGGAGIAILGITNNNNNSSNIGTALGEAFIAISLIPVGALGIILLDGQSGQTIQFHELKSTDASALGVSEDDIGSYNANLDKINDALKSVEFDLSQEKTKPTLDDSKAAWENYDAAIPVGAMNVVAKVSAQTFKK